MNKTKLTLLLGLVAMTALSIPIVANRLRAEKQGKVQVGQSLVHSPAPSKSNLSLPEAGKDKKEMRRNNTGAPLLRGIVLNPAGKPYVAEFTATQGMQVSNVFSDSRLEADGSAVYANGYYYVSCMTESDFSYGTTQYVFNTSDWSLVDTREGLLLSSSAACMTYDKTTGTIYTMAFDDFGDNGLTLTCINTSTGRYEKEIKYYEESEAILAMAASPEGNLYGVNVNGMFCQIDKKTGKLTQIGHTDVKPRYLQSATFDPQTGKLYWAAFTDENKSILYEINVETGKANKIADITGNLELTGLYVVPAEIDPKAPAAPTDLTIDFPNGALSGSVSFKMPETTVDGQTLNGEMTAYLATGSGNGYNKKAQPGETVTFNASFHSEGPYTFRAWAESANGEGLETVADYYIGPDVPEAPTNVVLVNEDGKAVLTWDAPQKGEHGGFIDPDKVLYTIYNDFEAPIREYKGTRYEYDVPASFSGELRFGVRPQHEELVSRVIAYSNYATFGSSVLDVPVTLNPGGSDASKFTIVDVNDDGDTWGTSFYGSVLSTSSSTTDDWLISPAINLKAGYMYEIEFEAGTQYMLQRENIEVYVGSDTNPSSMEKIGEKEQITEQYKIMQDVKREFLCGEDGHYHFALRGLPGSYALYVGYISIKEGAMTNAPQAPTEITVSPAEKGALKAQISFKAPTNAIDNSTLSAIGKIEIKSAGRVVGSIENPVPGQRYTVNDENAVNGVNRYQATAYLTTGVPGLTGEGEAWIGIDSPELPTNVKLAEIDGRPVLTWEHPTKGIHGGYVDPEGLRYFIYQYAYMPPVAQNISGTSYVFPNITNPGPQSYMQVSLGVSNEIGANEDAELSNSIIIGSPHTLPLLEHFGKVWSLNWSRRGSVYEDGGWDDDMYDIGQDDTEGIQSYWGMFDEENQALMSCKFTLKGSEKPVMRVYLNPRIYNENDYFVISIAADDYSPEAFTDLLTLHFTEEQRNQWIPYDIDLSEYKDKDALYLSFEAFPRSGNFFIFLDEFSIRDITPCDPSIRTFELSAPEAEVGLAPVTAKVRIENHGTEILDSDKYTIDFNVNDRRFASLPGVKIEPYGYKMVDVEFNPLTTDPTNSEIICNILASQDKIQKDNVSEALDIYIYKPEMPVVDDLTGKVEGDEVTLNWTTPDQSGKPVRTLTDEFEDYRPFSIDKAGLWTMYDMDRRPTVPDYYFPDAGAPAAWTVMNPGMVQLLDNKTLAGTWPAFSGNQYLIAFPPEVGDNNDWLVTPELSGKAQTINFMARGGSIQAGREMFEVYVSSTGKNIADMVPLDTDIHYVDAGEWSEFSFNVPEGTKYFAVRCVSHNRRAMLIDDFTYESAATPLSVQLKGYNVYRNGEKINKEIITGNEFRETLPASDDEVTYVVTVVYDKGESLESNAYITYGVSGVDTILTEWPEGPVYELNGMLVTKPVNGKIYVSRNGKFIYRTK